MSRWKKRSKDKRAELLKRASALLPERRGVTSMELTQSNGGDFNWEDSRTNEFRYAMLLPYLGLDTLKDNPAFMYALMHYRTTYSLENWASFDLHQFRNPWKLGLISIDLSPMCVVVHGTEYGKLVSFDAASVHRGDAVGFPRAQLLLEAQANLMQLLVKVFDLTLEGANLNNPSSTKWSAMCQEGFRSSGDVAQWSSYSNQAFSSPPTLDLDSIVSAAQIRFDAAADHLALLQTDPAYVRRYIRIMMQGAIFKSLPKTDAFMAVDRQIGFEIQSMYWWFCIKEEAEHTRDVRHRLQDQIHRGSPLPRQYDHALASLELVLVNYMNVRGMAYRQDVVQRPGFSDYMVSEVRNGRFEMRARADIGTIQDKFVTDPLFWCLLNLCAEPDQLRSMDHAIVFTILEDHLARSSAEERARLDQFLFEKFSDLATNHQLLLTVRLSRPQNKAGDGDEMLLTENRRAWKDRLIRAGQLEVSPMRAAVLKQIYEATPPQGRRDALWIERHEYVHSKVSTYWSSIRAVAKDHMKDEVVARHMKADLDPLHQAELAKERQTVLDDIESRKVVHKPSYDFSTPSNDEKAKQTEKKVKAKTRPEPQGKAEQPQDSSSRSQTVVVSTPSAKTVPASKRAIGIFSRMFSVEAGETDQGCDWDQFVHAMRDVGFSARNSNGSAVVFELQDQGKIIFHRPHPVAKIDLVMLKAMGKRMSKWFGWSKGSFVEAS